MDPISIVFYAIICGCLGWAAPKLGAAWIRLGIGAAVGVAASMLLPVLRDVIGGGY